VKLTPPQIILIPNGNSSNPKTVRRSEDISIVSIIKFDCNQSLSMKTKWIIRSNSNRIQLNSVIVTTSSELFIPLQTLQYGIYQFELTVTMTNSSWFDVSKSTYIEIIPTKIIVNLFYLGTSMVTNGYEQDLLLDPGKYSIDPDNQIFNTSVS